MSIGRRYGTELSRNLAAIRADYAFAATDAALMVASYLLVFFITTDRLGSWLQPLPRVVLIASVVHLICNAALGLYGLLWRQAGIDEARRMILAGCAAIAVLAAASFAFGRLPVSVVILGPTVATLLTGMTRFRSRLFAWQRGSRTAPGTRLVVIGAGRTGATLVRDLLANPQGGSAPVAILDDDLQLRGRTIKGVPVLGGLDDLPALAADLVVNQVVLAVPSAGPELVQRAAVAAERIGVPLKIVPGVHELISGVSPRRQVRKARIEDLLGRTQVDTDLAGVSELVKDRTVLLTGAGGSIGSEIARQVARFHPTRLVLLDHDETHLHDVSASVGDELGATCVQVLADIRDREVMTQLFAAYRPDLVFHAAAHKHVPILERFPIEAITTNVFGTLNVLDAAADSGTERFVFISTDKAVRPKNVLGATKRLAEQLIAARSRSRGRYCAVRFGNVLGSRGSVVPTFERQIASGGPVTITDSGMSRFFMSIEEAVQLVLQAAVFTDDNDLFMLEMGEQVRIVDLAHQMIRLSGYAEHEIELVITGARAGEKTEEELHSPSEQVHATPHPSIARLVPARPSLDMLNRELEDLRGLVDLRESEAARDRLFRLVNAIDDAHHASGLAESDTRPGGQRALSAPVLR